MSVCSTAGCRHPAQPGGRCHRCQPNPQQALFADPPKCRACQATQEADCRWQRENEHLRAIERDRRPKTCLAPRYDPATAPLPAGY